MREDQSRGKQKPDRKPAIILTVAAIIIFGLMIAFLYATNQNINWLLPVGGRG